MKILLAEDETDSGVVIYRTLCQQDYIIDWVKDGITAWNYLDNQANSYTVAILNLTLPLIDGMELCKRLRAQPSSILIVALTTFDRWHDGIASLDAGADDYLVKPCQREELLARLRALRRRSPQYRPLKLQFGSLILDCDSRTLFHHLAINEQHSVILSKKEFQLLEYLMQYPQRAVSQEHLLNYLYSVESERNSNVIAAQIRRLRRKLSEIGCQSTIQTLPGGYYRLNPNFNSEPNQLA
ncbi:MAG: two-component system response regulator RppA [Leptolyngbyaceae cyanobacterium bins.349]|nr:two-component system response regulator RppA [Leptolyngbyaceae cyanobacterium bins.349]